MQKRQWSVLALTVFAAAGYTLADGGKSPCCSAAQEVIHTDDKKHDDHDHAGHDHGGGVFDAVKKQGSLNTLAAAISQAELEETLSHDDWTVFAPTDEAFAKLPPETLDMLLQPENKEKLKAVLLAHVVKGAVASSAVKSEPVMLTTAQGSELKVVKDAAGRVKVGNANVVKADNAATNGVIHTIDAVIIPAGLLE